MNPDATYRAKRGDAKPPSRIQVTSSRQSRKRRQLGRILIRLIALMVLGWMIIEWDTSFSMNNPLVVYFGRPSDIPRYISGNLEYLLWASQNCFLTAVTALVLAGISAVALLAVGMMNESWLARIEWTVASLQTIPFLVIVTVCLLGARALFDAFNLNPSPGFYSLVPVTTSLAFPPIIYGAKGIIRTQIQIKSLLRLWQAPIWWRISRVYLPSALPDILTGIRTSATWAVGATLISDGLVDGVAMNARTLGHLLVRPFSAAPPGQTPTVVIIATLLAFAVYYLFSRAQFHIERWLLGSVVHTEQAYTLQND